VRLDADGYDAGLAINGSWVQILGSLLSSATLSKLFALMCMSPSSVVISPQPKYQQSAFYR